MQILNMQSDAGNPVPNQFVIVTPEGTQFFQSYETIVAAAEPGKPVRISDMACDYSQTTTKYLRRFMGWSGRKGTTRKLVDEMVSNGTAGLVEPDDLKEMFARKTVSPYDVA
jgi:hypothetical protein